MPKRSASSMTMTVALGTSTPTSMTVVATRTCRPAGTELCHHGLLLRRRQLPVQQAEAQARQRPGTEAGELLAGRGGLDALRLLDQGADDVGLVAGGDLLAHRPPGRLHLRGDRVAQIVLTGVRPGGSSSSTVVSRSP